MALRNRRPLATLLLLVTVAACGRLPMPEPKVAPAEPQATAPAAATQAPRAKPRAQEQAEAVPTATATRTESSAPATATATSTHTPTSGGAPPATAKPAASRCAGLSGQLEIQVLVGPAEAVGLEPVAVGSVPFAVVAADPPYLVQGQGPISYEATLELEKGAYIVTMDLDMTVEGECSGQAGAEQLALTLEMTGEQLVVVDVEGFHGEYPWAGTQSRDVVLPLEEGATAQGEGWGVVLHLGSP